jgi:hypothetical protein
MTSFDKPAFSRRRVLSRPQIPVQPGLLQPGHAGGGVKDLRGHSLSRVRLSKTSSQSITNGGSNKVLTWDSTDVDTDEYVSGNDVVIPFTGQYEVAFTVKWAVASTNYRQAVVEVSTDEGNTWSGTSYLLSNEAALTGYATINHGCAPRAFDKGDMLRLTVFQDSGGPINVAQAYLGVMFNGPS